MSDADISGLRRKDDVPPEPTKHFNPEEHISEKREWTKRQQQQQKASSAAATKQHIENAAAAAASPSSPSTTSTQNSTRLPRMYEHFCIVGLPPTINVKAVSADIQTYQTARRASAAAASAGAGATTSTTGPSVGDLIDIVPDTSNTSTKQYGMKGPVHSAHVLTIFPASPQLPEDLAANVAAFCFPHDVRPELLERTPSMSGLNEVVFGQPYQTQSDHSFVFRMSVADPGDPTPRPLYGVCCYARELVHRPPALARDVFPSSTAPLARYMVTAPRCYCLLTRYPFFDLHFRVLHTVLGLERLDRMSTFADEVALGLVTSTGNSIMRYYSVNDNPDNINGGTGGGTNSNNNSTIRTSINTNSTGEDLHAALGIHRHLSVAPSPGQTTTSTTMTSSTGTELSPHNNDESCTSSEEEDDDDQAEFCGRQRGGGLGDRALDVGPDMSSSTGFATPMHATTEDLEIIGNYDGENNTQFNNNEEQEEEDGGEGDDGSRLTRKLTGGNTLNNPKKKVVHLSRGLSEGTECEGLSPVASTSSLGSDLTATPSAPLLPSTPFYTPAPNSVPLAASTYNKNGISRRMTKYHGGASPGPPPLLLDPQNGEENDNNNEEEDAGDARDEEIIETDDLLGRLENVKQLLDDSLIELDTRLRPSPPPPPLLLDISPPLTQDQEEEQQNEGQIGGKILENSVDLISSSLDLGNWVGATDAQGQPLVEPQQQQESNKDTTIEDLSGLNDALAAGLTLHSTPLSSSEQNTQGGALEDSSNSTTIATEMNEESTINRLDGLDVLEQYLNTAVPHPGESASFQPDPVLQPILYQRPAWIPTLRELGLRLDAPALPDIDAASNLRAWTISALCQSLSLESILTFFSAVLLERQVVLFCPNVGVLCGVALSLVPLLLPFSWQSLLLPVLPATASRLDLLEAPVPFVVGVLFKTQEVRSRCGGLVRVNIYKDRVRNAGSLPVLPHATSLAEALAGPHAELQRVGRERAAAARPVHVVDETQSALAEAFSSTLQKYLQALVADLKGYTITDVSEGSGEQQRVSVLLKESFLESFPARDRTFMRQFAETQMFSVYCDSVLG